MLAWPRLQGRYEDVRECVANRVVQEGVTPPLVYTRDAVLPCDRGNT